MITMIAREDEVPFITYNIGSVCQIALLYGRVKGTAPVS
jgi:hypothetical protein